LSAFQNACDILDSVGNRDGKAWQLQNIGSVYRDTSHSEKALDAYFKSIGIFEEVGNKLGIADQCTNIAYIYYVDKKVAEALKWYKKALPLYEELDQGEKAAMTRQNIGSLSKLGE